MALLTKIFDRIVSHERRARLCFIQPVENMLRLVNVFILKANNMFCHSYIRRALKYACRPIAQATVFATDTVFQKGMVRSERYVRK